MHATRNDQVVVEVARRHGYQLRHRESDIGQVVWTWDREGGEPAHPFLTRGQAIAFMANNIARMRGPQLSEQP